MHLFRTVSVWRPFALRTPERGSHLMALPGFNWDRSSPAAPATARSSPPSAGLRLGSAPWPGGQSLHCGGNRTTHGLPAGVLHPERFRVLDDGPGRREAAGGHYPSLLRPSTSRKISCEASSPDSILPICSGGIDVIIWALTSRPLPEGNTGSQAPDHCSHAAWNIDGASMMTAPTGGRLASPKVSKK
jgi:hypothetical protein